MTVERGYVMDTVEFIFELVFFILELLLSPKK